MMRCFHRITFLIFFLSAAFGFAQQSKPLLKVEGKIAAPITITQEDWSKLPRATVFAARGHSTDKVRFDGVPLKIILEKAGALQADQPLKGKQLLQYVVVSAMDGYRVLFSLAELEDATGATSNVLLADKADGKPLGEKEAPLQLIVPSDHRPARSVRMVTVITVGTAE